MTAGCVLAIDQGTSGTKAIVIDADHRVVASATEPVRPEYGPGGRVEIDPQQLWQSVLAAGASALKASRRTVDAVALANQGETVLAWDRATGAPSSAAVVWQDRRAEQVCARLRPAAARVERISGLRLDSYFAAPKMAWLRQHGHTGGVVTTSDSWLLAKLTGQFVTDTTTASRTALLDLDTGAWSPDLVDLFGLSGHLLPRIVDCDTVIGQTTAFGPPVPVAGVVVDQQAALFAQGCHQAGQAKCTYGTGGFVLANTGAQRPASGSGLVACVAWRAGGHGAYCLDGQVYTVGSVVDWLQQVGVITGPQDLDRYALPSGTPGDEVFIPSLAGLAAPYWKPTAKGLLAGVGLSTGRAQIVSAVLEGLAASVQVLCEAVQRDTGRPISRLRVDGGLTRSHALMQRQADLLQCPVEVYSSPDATAFGAAGFARLGMGWCQDLADAIPGPGDGATVYTPQCDPDQAKQRIHRWRRGVDLVTEMAEHA